MFDPAKTIVTGGAGLLGTELLRQFPNLIATNSKNFDVTDIAQMEAFIAKHDVNCILHAAAVTSPPLVDKDPIPALQVNIIGTANVTQLCSKHNLKLVYICTDYVFDGQSGNYKEEDPVHPVNKYAWSKLGGECAVRLHDQSLIIRTTFGPNEFPYPKAFTDQWTSRESVTAIVTRIGKALNKDLTGVLHIGGARKTVYEFAKSLDETKEIGGLLSSEVGFSVPKDTSLNTNRYDDLVDNVG